MKKLPASWQNNLQAEFEQAYMQGLARFLNTEKTAGKIIFPPENLWFNAFESTDFDTVKVVILGQDPYHGVGQAHGLCFSVQGGVRVPPSLVNIYKELKSDLGLEIPTHGNLQSWADQGVLLLNTTLTVEEGQAASHQRQGWEQFTDSVITTLNEQREGLVFMLWGSHAQKKIKMLNGKKHLILKAPHPSPLSSYRGFFGCKHFSQANDYLQRQGQQSINWSVPD